MKIKLMPMFAGVLVLGAVAAPFAVKAQANPSAKPLMAQAQQGQRQGKEGKWAKLNLTDAQKQQMSQIKKETHDKIQAILTQEQRAQMETMKQNRQAQNGQGQARQGRRGGMASLNLTDDQKASIKAIMQEQKSRMEQVLTPEQRQQMEQMRSQWQQQRQQRQQGN